MKSFYLACCIGLATELLPRVAGAHPGHSAEGTVAHSFEHAVWIGASVLLAVVVAALVLLRSSGRGNNE